MKLITITQPAFFEGEAEAITSLFDAGLEILHLRKPGASYEDMEQLLNRLPPEYLKRIVTHEHFQLASFRNLKGIHLNGRNPTAPAGFTGHISRAAGNGGDLPFAGRSRQIQSSMRLRISQSHIRQHFQRRIFLCLYYRQLAKGAAGEHYRR